MIPGDVFDRMDALSSTMEGFHGPTPELCYNIMTAASEYAPLINADINLFGSSSSSSSIYLVSSYHILQ